MITFRDMAFCNSDCNKSSCYRYFGKEQEKAAAHWWGSDDAPVAFADFHKDCPDYQPQETIK